MKRDIIILILILLVVVFIVKFLHDNSNKTKIYLELEMKDSINFLFILEDENKSLLAMQSIFLNLKTGNSGFLDLPVFMGYEDLKGNISWFKDIYERESFEDFLKKLAFQIKLEPDYYILLTKDNFISFIDYLRGVEVLINEQVDVKLNEEYVLLPSAGNVLLDGDKAFQYLKYFQALDKMEERQTFFKSFFESIINLKNKVEEREYFNYLYGFFKTDLSKLILKYIIQSFNLNREKQIFIGVKGQEEVLRTKKGRDVKVVFPYYRGQLLYESINGLKLSLENKDVNEGIKVTILNGTNITGLAKNTADIYISLGFDVVKIANAKSQDYEKSVALDNAGSMTNLKQVADVIKLENIKPNLEREKFNLDTKSEEQDISDVIIILGRDFDGRYVRD